MRQALPLWTSLSVKSVSFFMGTKWNKTWYRALFVLNLKSFGVMMNSTS